MKATLAIAGVALALAAAVQPAQADDFSHKRTIDQSVSAAGASSIMVLGTNGNVHLYADGGTSVRVHATLEAPSDDVLKMVSVQMSRTGGTVRIQDICPTTRYFFWTTSDCTIELEVHYPRSFATNVQSSNGNITVDGAASSVSVANTNGNVHVNGAGGAVSVKNTNGNVRIDGAPSNVSATDTNGNVNTVLASNWRGTAIAMSTSAGNVVLGVPRNFDAKLNAHTRMGDVRNRANLRSGPVTVTASTTFGNVVIDRE